MCLLLVNNVTLVAINTIMKSTRLLLKILDSLTLVKIASVNELRIRFISFYLIQILSKKRAAF
jgi:hypothetical protein